MNNKTELKKLKDFEEGLDSDSNSSSDSAGGRNENDADSQSIGSTDSDTSSDGSDDEEMEVNFEDIEKKLVEINNQLLTSPYNYELLVEKIELLRSMGDLPSLRSARERMSEYYPLSERLWLQWITDETKICDSAEEKEAVNVLFERAVQDYLSVEVWLEYIKFKLGQIKELNGIQNCRDICERALAVAGLHVPLGSLLWDAYRDFEAAVLPLSLSEEDKNAQEKRYINLCRRQISVPLFGMEETFADISSKIDLEDNHLEKNSAALKKFKSIEKYEQELVNVPDVDLARKAAVYTKYIDAEKAEKSNPARIQCLYERAVAECPLDSSLWLAYLSYVTNHLKIPDIILNVASRATRNCPWVLECWAEYFIQIEAFSPDKLISIFEKAILNFTTVEQVGTLWLKYLESLRRTLRANDFPDAEVEKFRSTCDAAERHILTLAPESEPNEFVFQIVMLSTRLSILKSKIVNIAHIRENWKDLLVRGYGYSFRNWLHYLNLEKEFGDESSYRLQLSRSVSYIKDDFQGIADLWLNYERDFGTVAQLRACEKKIAKYLEALTVDDVNTYNTTNPNTSAGFLNRNQNRKFGQKQNSNVRMDTQSGKNKRRKDTFDLDYDDNISPPKKQKNRDRDRGTDVPDSGSNNGATFKIPHAPKPLSSSSPGGVKKETAASLSSAAKDFESRRVHHDPSKDERTVFVSNLAFTVTEDQLTDFFKDVGVISELRLVKDFKGRSKGYAYVVFQSAESVPKALGKDRDGLEGRPVFVSKCDPDKSNRAASSFKFPLKLEKNKLFVKGLPLTMDVAALRKLFVLFGPLKDVRLVTFRNGHSKGIAYVDYDDEESAAKAVKEMDGKELEGQAISVSISNPPAKTDHKDKDVPSDMLILQRRVRAPFVPRSVQVQKKPETPGGGGSSGPPKKPMSNEDFKNFFKKASSSTDNQ